MSGVTVTPSGSDLPSGEERRAPSGRWPALAGLLLFVALLAAMMIKLESDAVSDPVKKAERGEVGPTSVHSLTRAENLGPALEVIEADLPPGGYLEDIYVSPALISATVVEESGLRRDLTINVAFDLESEEFGAADAVGPRPVEIPADAIETIIAAAEGFALAPENFQYATVYLSNPSVTTSWSAFWEPPLKDNSVSACIDGSKVRLIDEVGSRTCGEPFG